MQGIKAICSDFFSAFNTTVTDVYGERKEITKVAAGGNATLSDTDPSGAVKFTIAVVLLYGVGVIGLLGIMARRNRRVQLMDKEVNRFLKMQYQCDSFARNSKHRKRKVRAVDKLIAALHFQDDNIVNENEIVTQKTFKKCSSSWHPESDDNKANDSRSICITTNAAVSMALINETDSCITTCTSWDKASVHSDSGDSCLTPNTFSNSQ